MIIAIDGYEANTPRRVGIGVYAFHILHELNKLLAESSHEVRVYLPNQPLADMPVETRSWRYRLRSPGKLWTFFALPKAIKVDSPQADVCFSPTHYIPRFVSVPRVMAIMDLSYLVYPQLFKAKDLHQLRNWTAYSVRKAAAIVTISKFSKNAIMEQYHAPETNVFVTYPGLSMEKTTIKADSRDMLSSFGVEGDYILSVGTLQPRKNFARLIEAFAIMRNESETYRKLTLVIVGKKGWLFEETLDAPKKYGVEHYVKFLDFVPDSSLPVLYSNAVCFVLPSLYEGFGLPVLEAMAHSCQVVVSDSSSLPEIAGDAGIYVEPENTKSIADGLIQAIKERSTKQGKDRIAKGLARVKLFSWEKAARQTLEVLEKIGGR